MHSAGFRDRPILVPVNFCKDGRLDVAVNDKLFPNFRKNWGQRNGPQVFVSITNRWGLREGCNVRFLPRSWKATLQKGRKQESATGAANKSAFSLSNQEVIPSGPDTLFVLSADNFLRTENSDIGRGGSCWCTYACTSSASPFTVIPDDEGLRALKHFFHQRTVKEPCSEKLLSPAKLVLTLNCFSFGGNYYKQTTKVPKRDPVTPIF